jgi:hypothetical protein
MFYNGVTLFVFLIITFFVYSCKEDTTPTQSGTSYENNTINGTITFVGSDSTFLTDTTSANGYFSINAYTNWPPTAQPIYSKLKFYKSGNVYKADYKLVGLADNGSYLITTAYIKLPYGPNSVSGLGFYYNNQNGCDTSHSISCQNNASIPRVTITNNQGVGNINFLSWIDKSNKIYQF